jgi:hypothetical protein
MTYSQITRCNFTSRYLKFFVYSPAVNLFQHDRNPRNHLFFGDIVLSTELYETAKGSKTSSRGKSCAFLCNLPSFIETRKPTDESQLEN